jgi:hypothetical protein
MAADGRLKYLKLKRIFLIKKKLPTCAMAGFDLTTLGFASRDDTTKLRRQG